MTNINPKKKMKIAMVGVSPADQITFKGYLRVLLRLDVDLDWVSAQVGEVDLYVINEDFKNSASVQKLVDVHPLTPILYVSRNLTGDGGISDNSLVLPLKQINELNTWLYDKVTILKTLSHQQALAAKTTSKTRSTSSGQSHNSINNEQTSHLVSPKQASLTEVKSSHHEKLSDVVEMIETLHDHPHSLFELLQDEEVFAVIDGTHRLVWPKSAKAANIDTWRLRVYGGTADESKQANNLNQWLYQIGLANADKLLPLFKQNACYQLSSWSTPIQDIDDSTLQVMTALKDNQCTLDEVVATTGLSRLMVQKIIVSLLFAQYLTDSSYQSLNVNSSIGIVHQSTSQESGHDASFVSQTAKTDQKPEESLGLLARLHRKLKGT